ncbi:MAG TPA: hypothetical protein PK024_07185 [Methanospirillum sp.]|nr:hypothetical protein [Methanospirillum sp.]
MTSERLHTLGSEIKVYGLLVFSASDSEYVALLLKLLDHLGDCPFGYAQSRRNFREFFLRKSTGNIDEMNFRCRKESPYPTSTGFFSIATA